MSYSTTLTPPLGTDPFWSLRRNKMKHLVPMIPKIKNKSMPCPYNLSDAIDAANAPKDSEEQK